MTDIIASDVQSQELPSGIVTLFEIELPNGTKAYFHPGLEGDLTTVHFRDYANPSIINEYVAIPMQLGGLEIQSDGAMNRPTFSVANVTNEFTSELGYTYKDLIGQRLTRRQTFKKYLDDGTGNSQNPPVELNKVTYIIDRISSEDALLVSFEVSSVYDLEGVVLPRRVVTGKYCNWIYQGAELLGKGGCVWGLSSEVQYSNEASANTINTAHVFFDLNDNQLSKSSTIAALATTYADATSYTQNSYVSYNSEFYLSQFNHTSSTSTLPGTSTGQAYWKKVFTYRDHATGTNYSVGDLVRKTATLNGKTIDTVWYCINAHNSSTTGTTPQVNSTFWRREDSCGKTLESCKCRFQATVVNDTVNNSEPSAVKDTNSTLPFGSFPGVSKF